MQMWRWTATLALTVGIAGVVAGCLPPGDDDDTSTPTPGPSPEPTSDPGDDDSSGGGDDDDGGATAQISGTVHAVDSTTGVELTAEEYAARAGVIVVYALQDPADLVHVSGKATLQGPGYYSLDVPDDSGPLYVVAVADVDWNNVITGVDLLRESPSSPVSIAGGPADNVDVTFELAARGGGGGGGGGGGPDYAPFSGQVVYDADDADVTNIAIVAFPGDYGDSIYGLNTRVGSGDYSVGIAIYSGTSSLIGYADADFNGVYEPSDPAGLAENNPYSLTTAGMSGVDILIEGLLSSGLPQPIPYVSISGTVTADDGYTGTPISLKVTNSSGDLTYTSTTLSEPGDFSLRMPGKISGVVVTAMTDSDGDGLLGGVLDASTSYGPFDVGSSNVGGIHLDLVTPEDPDTGIEGVVTWSGTVSEQDRLAIAVFSDPTTIDGPVLPMTYLPAVFPASYEVLELDALLDSYGVDSMTIYVAAALDVDSDMVSGPAEGDITGAYTFDGTNLAGIEISRGTVLSGIDIAIGNWSGGG